MPMHSWEFTLNIFYRIFFSFILQKTKVLYPYLFVFLF